MPSGPGGSRDDYDDDEFLKPKKHFIIEMTESLPLCKNCMHFKRGYCFNPEYYFFETRPDYVYGRSYKVRTGNIFEPKGAYSSFKLEASFIRNSTSALVCGPEGKFFERKKSWLVKALNFIYDMYIKIVSKLTKVGNLYE